MQQVGSEAVIATTNQAGKSQWMPYVAFEKTMDGAP
jgi:hypothetical protein